MAIIKVKYDLLDPQILADNQCLGVSSDTKLYQMPYPVPWHIPALRKPVYAV